LKTVDAAREVGFSYCVIGNKLYSFAGSRAFTTGRCLISEGSANTSFVDSVVELELGGAVQVGVHPMNYRANKVFELLEDMRDRLDYHFIGYLDYLRSVL
jgi:hypothetical protein